MNSIERVSDGETSSAEFEFSGNDVSLNRAPINPEAYVGCLVRAMKASNRGNGGIYEEVMSTVVASRDRDLAMACGKCGITMVRDAGVVYGASKCPQVVSGQETLGELA